MSSIPITNPYMYISPLPLCSPGSDRNRDPPLETPNSAADVVQTAHLKSTWCPQGSSRSLKALPKPLILLRTSRKMLIGSLHGISKVVGMPPAVIKAGSKVAQKLSLVSLMCA